MSQAPIAPVEEAAPVPPLSQRRSPDIGKRAASHTRTTLSYVVLGALSVFSLLPITVMLGTSFKPANEVFRMPATLLPENFTVEHYRNVFTSSDMPAAIANSVIIGVMVTMITLVIGGMTGYAIARLRYRGSGPVAIAILLGQLLPITVLLLPLFQLVSRLGAVDSLKGIAITHLTIVLPLVTWMSVSTIRGVPVELEEAAMIDGCGRPKAVWLVVLPVAAPSIIALSIFAFLQSWNEFVFASVIARSVGSKTAPVALTDFAGQFQTDWGATMAAATVIAVPITILFLFVQRYFVHGMSAGAVKG